MPKGRLELLNQILMTLAKTSVSCGSRKSMSVGPAPRSNIQCFQRLWLPVWLFPKIHSTEIKRLCLFYIYLLLFY